MSEDPAIDRFAPHRAPGALTDDLLVWAVDTRHLPLFWYPRDCPRCTFWAGPRTADRDIERFLAGRLEARVHVIEDRWMERVRDSRLFLYRMPPETFTEHPETAGYWTSRVAIMPVDVTPIDGLVERHAEAGIVLRTAGELWSLWDEVTASTLEFSGIRLRNARPRSPVGAP